MLSIMILAKTSMILFQKKTQPLKFVNSFLLIVLLILLENRLFVLLICLIMFKKSRFQIIIIIILESRRTINSSTLIHNIWSFKKSINGGEANLTF